MKSLYTYIFFLIIGISLTTSSSYGYVLIEMNLEEIVSKSQYIFRGVCEKRETVFIQPTEKTRISATEYSFVVKEMLKGEPTDKITFKQYGVSRSEAQKTGRPMMIGFTSFEPEKEYIIGLSAPSPLGLSSVVGFGGGVFDVMYSPDGDVMVVNKFSNSNLFRNMKPESSVSKTLKSQGVDIEAPRKGPMDYELFKSTVNILK